MTPYLQQRTLYPPQILKRPSQNLGLVVVIPAYDEPYLLLSLLSLKKCALPGCGVEVIVVLNDGEQAPSTVRERHRVQFQTLTNWAFAESRPELSFHILYKSGLPKKHAGVGLARKIGMDEAAWRLQRAGNPRGVISCFDADSRCTPNYLQALELHFQNEPDTQACSIHFEHPLEGADFPGEVYAAITEYELHLRYYIQAQRFAGFPFAYHTIGSSMAVRSDAYQKQGGMNRRKAGEDFYFLHKFIELGHFSELFLTKVIPSPRPSQRVPFGTGKAIGESLAAAESYTTYAPQSFLDLKAFFLKVPSLYEGELTAVPESITAFLKTVDVQQKLAEIRAHTSTPDAFVHRFYRWFNAFMLMKYMHFAREHFYAAIPVMEAASWLLEALGQAQQPSLSAKTLLLRYRELDKLGYS